MKQIFKWLLVTVVLVALTACSKTTGGGSTGGANNNSLKVHQKTYSYDLANRVVKEDLGNGQYIKYVYDDSGNLVSQTVVK